MSTFLSSYRSLEETTMQCSDGPFVVPLHSLYWIRREMRMVEYGRSRDNRYSLITVTQTLVPKPLPENEPFLGRPSADRNPAFGLQRLRYIREKERRLSIADWSRWMKCAMERDSSCMILASSRWRHLWGRRGINTFQIDVNIAEVSAFWSDRYATVVRIGRRLSGWDTAL